MDGPRGLLSLNVVVNGVTLNAVWCSLEGWNHCAITVTWNCHKAEIHNDATLFTRSQERLNVLKPVACDSAVSVWSPARRHLRDTLPSPCPRLQDCQVSPVHRGFRSLFWQRPLDKLVPAPFDDTERETDALFFPFFFCGNDPKPLPHRLRRLLCDPSLCAVTYLECNQDDCSFCPSVLGQLQKASPTRSVFAVSKKQTSAVVVYLCIPAPKDTYRVRLLVVVIQGVPKVLGTFWHWIAQKLLRI